MSEPFYHINLKELNEKMWRLGTIKELACFKIPKALGAVSRAKNTAYGHAAVSRKVVGKRTKVHETMSKDYLGIR